MFANFLEFCATVRTIARKEEERIRYQLGREMKAPADVLALKERLKRLEKL